MLDLDQNAFYGSMDVRSIILVKNPDFDVYTETDSVIPCPRSRVLYYTVQEEVDPWALPLNMTGLATIV